ncbi:MAG: hypothetical protein WBX00_35210 [Isosphaeraceae bacterium]
MKKSQTLDFAKCETERISVSWPGWGRLARLALLGTSAQLNIIEPQDR